MAEQVKKISSDVITVGISIAACTAQHCCQSI